MKSILLNFKTYLFLLPPVLFTVALFYFQPTDFYLNQKQFSYTTFTDQSIDGGKSQILKTSSQNDTFTVEFELKNGFISPYAGVAIYPKPHRYIDIEDYDHISLELDLVNTKNLELTIATFQNGITKENDPLTYRHNIIEIPISDEQQEYSIPLSDLRVAQWWLERYRLRSTELGDINFKKCSSLSLVAKIRLDENASQNLTIGRIKLYKDQTSSVVMCLTIVLTYTILLLAFLFFQKRSKKENSIVVQYEQVQDKKGDSHDIEIPTFIAINYTNPDLTLSVVSTETKIAESEISKFIKVEFGQNFKEYLNGIRVNEAKRLLHESTMNVSEIAFKVGFNSPNHFNRTFKNSVGSTPTEFRKKSF